MFAKLFALQTTNNAADAARESASYFIYGISKSSQYAVENCQILNTFKLLRMNILKNVRRWWRLPRDKQMLALEAGLWLGVMRVAIHVLSFKRIARFTGLTTSPSNLTPDAAQIKTAQQIRWAVQAMAPKMPWATLCLVQGLAGAAMLRRRHLPLRLYFGVARTEQGEFQAHAWLCCGQDILTGGAGHQRFSVIATYS